MTKFGDKPSMEIDTRHSVSHLAEDKSGSPLPKRLAPPVMSNFDHVRRNIRAHSQGIFDPPNSEQDFPKPAPAAEVGDPPAQAAYARISRSYLETVHEAYPVLHWPTFESEVDHLYNSGSLQRASMEWVGLFYAVLACGCLNLPSTDTSSGSREDVTFYNIASQSLSPWPQKPTIVHARLLLLLSIYASESGLKSAGSMWLASAIRVAQELGLNMENDALPFMESELRRRLWWSIYVRERSVALYRSLHNRN
jgi:hypothetical protein